MKISEEFEKEVKRDLLKAVVMAVDSFDDEPLLDASRVFVAIVELPDGRMGEVQLVIETDREEWIS